VTLQYDVAPGVPQNFNVERSNRLLILSWQPVGALIDGRPAADIAGYTVYRRVDSGEYEAALNAEPLSEARFEDIPPAYDTVYAYTVRAVRMSGKTAVESDASAEVRIEYFDITPPDAPQFLTAIAQPSGVLLKWMAKTEKGFAGYHIYRRPAGTAEFKRLNTELLRKNMWIDTTAVRRKRYEYAVTAVDDSLSANESPLSEPVPLNYIVD
jgi:fibronectin type 3 domain-containing protein